MMKRLLSSVAVLACAATPAFAQGSIDTVAGWNGTDSIASFGVVDTATYGQTITVTDAFLQGFDFEIRCDVATVARAHVYAWDSVNAHQTGASLFDGAPFTLAAGGTFNNVHVNTGSILLTPGTYVLYLTTSQDQAAAPLSECDWGFFNADPYAGGSFVFQNNGNNFGTLSTSPWTAFGDLAFRASLLGNAVPTMPEWTMIALIGVLTLVSAWMLRSSRRRLTLSH